MAGQGDCSPPNKNSGGRAPPPPPHTHTFWCRKTTTDEFHIDEFYLCHGQLQGFSALRWLENCLRSTDEAGLPNQAWNNCLWMHCHKSITDALDTACKDWRGVCLCQLKMLKVFWKIWGGICTWWKVRPQHFKSVPFPCLEVSLQ